MIVAQSPSRPEGVVFSALNSLIPVTLAFCIGIAWANFAAVPVAICWIVVILLTIRLLVLRLSPTFTSLFLLAFFFMVGGIHGTLALRPPSNPTDISRQITGRQEAVVIGVLRQSPIVKNGVTSLLMATEQILLPPSKITQQTTGLVKLSIHNNLQFDLFPGDKFLARAQLTPITSYKVPGAFDYRTHMAYQGIRISGWIKSPLLIRKIIEFPKKTSWQQLKEWPETIRLMIGQQLDKVVPNQAGIYKALLIGDRSGLAPPILEIFKACGIIHLLAISGIHMGLLALVITFTVTWLLKRSQWVLLHLPITKTAALLSLPPLFLYALIAGFHPPAVRALIMVMVFIAALLVNRQWSLLNNTAIAAMLILAINPALLYTASFQLSFGAMISIALFLPNLSKLFTRPTITQSTQKTILVRMANASLCSILISIAAIAGTAPILIYHFNRISLISPLTTLLIEPLLCLWALTCGLIGSIFLSIPSLSSLCFKTGAIGIDVSVKLASYFSTWPISIWLPSPTGLQIAASFSALICLSMLLKGGNRIIWGPGIIISTALFLVPQPGKHYNDTQVDILDVGHGCAIVLRLPDNHTILIDGGKRQTSQQNPFNVGQHLIAPFLWHQQINVVEAIVITHPHADHYNGLPFIMQHFSPQTLWVNSTIAKEKGFKTLLDLAHHLHIAIKTPQNNEILYQNGDIWLKATANLYKTVSTSSKGSFRAQDTKCNNQGLVLHLQHGQKGFLFTGDIEKEGEEKLLSSLNNQQLQANVIIVPHHGSRTSSSLEFIKAVKPHYAVISAEKNSHDTFPAPEVVKNYQAMGATVLNTAQNGSIFFQTDGTTLQALAIRPQ